MDPSRQLSVLIVDDDRDSAESMGTLLDLNGLAVRVACSAEECLKLARASPPDAVVLDIAMPRIDGLELAGQLCDLLERKPHLIVVSGYTDKDAECMAAGIDHYLMKPVDAAVLGELIREHAERGSNLVEGCDTRT